MTAGVEIAHGEPRSPALSRGYRVARQRRRSYFAPEAAEEFDGLPVIRTEPSAVNAGR
jgi:hypothetical protein